MRYLIAGLLLCLASLGAEAKQSPYPPVTQFNGDRYAGKPVPTFKAQMGADVAKSVKAKQGAKPRRAAPTRRHAPRQQRWRQVPIFAPYVGPGTVEPLAEPRAAEPLSAARGAWREVRHAVGRPRAWCGWWLGQHLGMPLRHLWLARNWAKVGSPAGGPAPGVIVVWRNHVGIITGRTAAGWIVKSGNDGHRVRERVRSVAGAIAFRSPSS